MMASEGAPIPYSCRPPTAQLSTSTNTSTSTSTSSWSALHSSSVGRSELHLFTVALSQIRKGHNVL